MNAVEEPFRILMVLDQPFPPDTRVENEARTLIDAGFEVGLLSIGPDTRPERETWRGIHIFRSRVQKGIRNKMRGLAGTVPFLTKYIDFRVRRLHREFRFDALHLHDLYTFGGGLQAARRLGVSTVGDMHENWPDALGHYAWSTRFPTRLFVSIPRWRRLERDWSNAVDRLIVTVEEMGERLRMVGVNHPRMVVLPNTVRTEDFDTYPEDVQIVRETRSAFTIVYTGSINLHRGLNVIIRAMPRVIERISGARLVIVGDGSIRPELQAQAERLGVATSVEFKGWQPQHQIKSYILGGDVGLIPFVRTAQTNAASPHKLFHYMYLERPVVVTNCRSLERIVTACQCGIVCPYGDVKAAADALIELADNVEMRREMGRNGRRAVLEKYNWEATARPLVDMYQEIARAK